MKKKKKIGRVEGKEERKSGRERERERTGINSRVLSSKDRICTYKYHINN